MPLLGFTRLLDKLEDGTKTQTTRLPRKKRPLKVGDKIYIYWHLRQKDCEKLGEGVILKMESKCPAEMTLEDARLDGFEDDAESTSLQKYALALREMHPKIDEFTKFDIITWKWTLKTFWV